MSSKLNTQQQKTLAKICDTFNPQLPPESNDDRSIFKNCAGDYRVADHLVRRFESLPSTDLGRIRKLLKIIETPLVCWMLTGQTRPFSQLDVSDRAKVLRRWCESRNQNLRTFFQSAKRMSLFFSYASTPFRDAGQSTPDTANPVWPSIGYSGTNPLNGAQSTSGEFSPITVNSNSQLDCEVLVVGSGAGASVVAAKLAESGIDTLICEKGTMPRRTEMGLSEIDGNKRLFDKHGALSTPDLSIVVLAGQTVGGGTTVNWMTSLDTPPSVRREWAEEFGFAEAANSKFDQNLSNVKTRLGVNQAPDVHNRQNEILRTGCERLGYQTATIPRNADNCRDCGFCGYGCRGQGKQDMRRTYLADAIGHGARIATGVAVNRILRRHGKIAGADLRVTDSEGNSFSQFVSCKKIVVAAGSIHTPALMLRSGFENPNIGRHLHLHPTTAIAAFHPEPVRAWEGPPQTIVCDQFADASGQGYGYRLEVAPLHPGFAAMALAWQSPVQHKRLMAQFENMANTIVLTRDKTSGRVTVDADGQPTIRYRLGNAERAMLIEGSIEAMKIQSAAGATHWVGPLQQFCSWSQDDFNEDDVRQLLLRRTRLANSFALFSAHQLSTCRMAKSARSGVCDPTGKVFECDNLYVADGSLLPTSTGVNPMISIMAVADFVGNNLV